MAKHKKKKPKRNALFYKALIVGAGVLFLSSWPPSKICCNNPPKPEEKPYPYIPEGREQCIDVEIFTEPVPNPGS